MRRAKLLQQRSDRTPRKGASPAPKKEDPSGLGNRDLLSQLGTAKAMPTAVRLEMEQTLGADFSDVRLYESPLVSQGGAEAAASGNQVAFAPGRMDFTSAAGLELLGHELSHVASQARGEATGSGFLNDPALERRADADGARAMRAFDHVSGGDLTPMSTGPAPISPAGPVQARKKSSGEKFLEGYNELSLPEKVATMRDRAIVGSMIPETDESEYAAVIDILSNADNAFLDEMFQQQIASAQALTQVKQSLSGGGSAMEDAEAVFRAKYSPEATKFQAFSSIFKDIGLYAKDAEVPLLHYQTQMRGLKDSDPNAFATLQDAQNILLSHERNNIWTQGPGAQESEHIRDEAHARDLQFARNWKRPRRSIFHRLFGRGRR